MEHVIQLDDDDSYALAFGLAWQTLDPIMSRSSQLQEFRREYGAHWLASFKNQGSENVGYAKNLILPPKLKTLSGAGQVATNENFKGKTVLVLLEEEGHDGASNDVAVIGLINGNITQDAFVKAEAVHEIRQKFFEQCARAGTEFITMGRAITIDPVEQPFKWLDLLPETAGNRFTGVFKKANTVPITALKADIPTWVLIMAVSVACIGTGVWYWQGKVADSNRLKQLTLQNKKPDPAQLYAESVAQLLAQPVLPVKQTMQELRAQLKAFPIQMVGWKLDKIDCAASGDCTAQWNRKSGTYKEFVDHAPKEWGEIYITSEGSKLSHAVPVKLTKITLPAKDKWPTERDFILTVVSQWQKYSDIKFKATLQPAGLAAVPATVQPQVASTLPSAIWAAKWDVKSANWWMSEALDTLPDNVTVDSVSLTFSNEINFNAEGKVYVRK